MSNPRIMVFASGTAEGGGSGFRNLVEAARAGLVGSAEIVGVVSSHHFGGVHRSAIDLRVPFYFHERALTAEDYRALMDMARADWAVLCGWNRKVLGLDPKRTVNIHPAPLPRFGGKGMCGLSVHQAVIDAFERGEITETAVTMHFVTEEYDAGPAFFRYPIALQPGETAEQLQERVKVVEHALHPLMTRLVVEGKIAWDGRDPSTMIVPCGHPYL